MPKNSFLFLPLVVVMACSGSKKISPYEFALMSADVYDAGLVKELPDHIELFMDFDINQFNSPIHIDFNLVSELAEQKDWKELAPYLAFKAFGKGGYFGRAYINTKSNQVIIAHRGTDIDFGLLKGNTKGLPGKISFKDLVRDIDDNYDILKGKIPYQQLAAAKYFTEVVKQDYRQKHGNKDPKIIHTGHSLGAVLAELSAVENKGKAITFESPGSYPMVEQLLEKHPIDKNSFKIITYNTLPNAINLTNPPAGKVIYLMDFDSSNSANDPFSDEAVRAAVEYHSIEGILMQFDPKTGKPVKR